MSGFDIGLLMFAATLLLIGLRMPVGIAMLLVGGLGYAAITGWSPLFATLRSISRPISKPLIDQEALRGCC